MTSKQPIFLIDDNQVLLYAHERVLAHFFFPKTVATFENAREAINLLDHFSAANPDQLPDTIFLDLNMPLMNGWQFLEEFERLNLPEEKKVTIFILSSTSDPDNIKKAKEHKCVAGFVIKPLTQDTLSELFPAIRG